MKGYVTYNGYRYRVINRQLIEPESSGQAILRLRPFMGPDVQVREELVQPWRRGKVRHIKGTLPHRGKRPVFIDLDTGTEEIRVRLRGQRKPLTCTFGGLYDVLARQQAMNAKRDRAFRKRTGRRA